ncbi:MAG: hypothetical protein K2Q11_00250 [Burkholderiaceae bacterium]|nr:hypothetical protein [Burkholderiaceae bacterium]
MFSNTLTKICDITIKENAVVGYFFALEPNLGSNGNIRGRVGEPLFDVHDLVEVLDKQPCEQGVKMLA